MVDSLKLFEILKSGHVPEVQARAMTVAIQTAESQIQLDFRGAMRQDFDTFSKQFELKLAETKSEIMRWMFVFWVSQFTATVGLVIAVLKIVK